MINIFNKNKIYTTKGFTLAEVLITLGIIGVVAAMTIPSLVAKYRSIVAVNQLKKMYSVLSQALLYTVQTEGDYTSLYEIKDGDSASIQAWYKTALKPYIKITNECFDNKPGCWAEEGTKYLNGNSLNYHNGIGTNIVVFNTIDGYSVNLDAVNDNESVTGAALRIYVDVNGKKLPNVLGKDIYTFVFSDRGFVPAGRDLTDEQVNSDCSKNGNGYYCFEKIMRNSWQIDKENLW